MTTSPRIDLDRLLGRLDAFNRIGALPGGGNCRLALSDEDRAGRDLLMRWMRDLGLTVTVDAIGNIIGVRRGREDLAPIMFGSHIDTVGTGGRYDGLYGVLAGLEACEALNDAGHATRRPLALVAFTNEEGSRFAPYAMGSLVYVGGLALEDAYAVRGIDGATVGEELRRIGYVGAARPGFLDRLSAQEQVAIATRSLARFAPVSFPKEMVSLIETTAHELAFSCRRLPSGAGHDAQMMARLCPATMIFVPSVGGLSHNVREHTEPAHLEAGASVLLHSVLRLAD